MEFDGVPANGDQIQQFGFGSLGLLERGLELTGQFGGALAGVRGPAEPANDPPDRLAATLAAEQLTQDETGRQAQAEADQGGRAGVG